MATTTIRKGGRIRSFFVGTAALIGAGAVVLAVLGQFFTLPFTTTERDHSAPPVLLELRNLADFHAAQARFEVTIDKEDDVAWVPSFVAETKVTPGGSVSVMVTSRAVIAPSLVYSMS